ncbi:MAG: FtsX-like permease family protein [Dehalococcoidia bacterium]
MADDGVAAHCANWRLTAVLALGVLVAATLLAAAPIYARAMADLGVTFAIRDRLRTAPTTHVTLRSTAIASTEGRQAQEAVATRTEERIGWFAGARERTARGPRLTVSPEGQAPEPRAPLAVLHTYSNAAANARVLDGHLPQRQPDAAEGRVLELALSPRAAEAGGLKLGDRLTLTERFDDCEREIPLEGRPPPPPCTPRVTAGLTIPARLVGLIEPVDPESPFWVGGPAPLFDPARFLQEFGPLLPALVAEDEFFSGFGGRLPEYRAEVTLNVFADAERLTRTNFRRAREDIVALRDDLRAVGGFAYSPLENTLADFDRELSFQQTPLLLLLLQIAAIALFYVAVIATMVVERQAGEIALLRSRGASRLQIGGVYLLEGLTVGVPVTVLAPPLAALTTALLGLTPAFRRASDGGLLPVRLEPPAFALAGLGAGLSLVMLAGPAFFAARMTGVASRRQAARPGPSFLRRYYLDLVMVALAALLLWELNERGSVFVPSATGGVSSDPLLLVSPALLTLGAAAVTLRLYPARCCDWSPPSRRWPPARR